MTMVLNATNQELPKDVPIFLKKTFAMIDSCDPKIAGWAEDDNGETFVVKDPEKFESVIIPQFFKHSKFSSFVRQLNFYAFRKIKYMDNLRIDPQLEAETANYWRFRHENFRKGRPDLLTEIKRMTGQKEKNQTTKSETNSPAVNAEVAALKKRIDDMSQNIDMLTKMVAKVNLKQEQEEVEDACNHMGAKRKKAEPDSFEAAVPVAGSPYALDDFDCRPDAAMSNVEMEGFASMPLPDPTPLSSVQAMSSSRTLSQGSVMDPIFVNELFSAFEDEDEGMLQFEGDTLPEDTKPASDNSNNNPDPELMRRLGDALAVLPRDIQEMIVGRLIQSITSTEFVEKCVQRAAKVEGVADSSLVEQTEVTPVKDMDATPLAAATFAALLHHYTTQVAQGGKSVKSLPKTLPIIPAHA